MPSKRGTRKPGEHAKFYKRPTTVDVGHPLQHQYTSSAKRHVVIKTESGWVLLCTKKPATREHTGFLTKQSINCTTCFKGATEALKAS